MLKQLFGKISDLDNLNTDEIFSSLPKYRQEKINCLQNENDKKLSLLAGYLLQKAFKQCGLKDLDQKIEVDKYGKEYLPGEDDINFSISHSNERVFVILTNKNVGCDIQEIKRGKTFIAERYFTKKEIDAINNAPDKDIKFFEYWAIKESYIKAIGKGLSIPLNSFEISDDVPYCTISDPEYEVVLLKHYLPEYAMAYVMKK